MPVHATHSIRAGARTRLILIHARDRRTGRGRTGLRADTPRGSAAYVREGERAVAVPLVPGRVGVWSPGSFAELDPGLAPGAYQFGVPDEMSAEGSARALLMLRFPGAVIDPIEIDLVAFDPLDGESLGMAQLQDRKRHEFLRRALPSMTEEELARGAEVAAELSERIDAARAEDARR
jgi:hypothetical protein